MCSVQDVEKILNNGIQTDSDRELLGQSMFYYCSGKDPTPVIAFGGEYPLYVYVDSLAYGNKSFEEEVSTLYSRLEQNDFRCESSRYFSFKHYNKSGMGNVAQWYDKNDVPFVIVCLHHDAEKAFQMIYAEKNKDNLIQPKCICNIKYECPEFGILNAVEKRVQYILGHSKSPKYKQIAEIPYHGDYFAKTVGYFRRAYWYVF